MNNLNTSAKKSRVKWFIIMGGIAGLCICILCVAVFGVSVFQVAMQKDDVAAVLDDFMQAMANKQPEEAYQLLSKRAQRRTPLAELEKGLDEANFVLFDGYQRIEVQNLNIGPFFNTNPDMPQGTVARVSGIVIYELGYTGKFEAVLEEDNDEWRVYRIDVTVPPKKFQDHLQDNQS